MKYKININTEIRCREENMSKVNRRNYFGWSGFNVKCVPVLLCSGVQSIDWDLREKWEVLVFWWNFKIFSLICLIFPRCKMHLCQGSLTNLFQSWPFSRRKKKYLFLYLNCISCNPNCVHHVWFICWITFRRVWLPLF